jgi:hypothetical protein
VDGEVQCATERNGFISFWGGLGGGWATLRGTDRQMTASGFLGLVVFMHQPWSGSCQLILGVLALLVSCGRWGAHTLAERYKKFASAMKVTGDSKAICCPKMRSCSCLVDCIRGERLQSRGYHHCAEQKMQSEHPLVYHSLSLPIPWWSLPYIFVDLLIIARVTRAWKCGAMHVLRTRGWCAPSCSSSLT